jgi:hypothetical protein
MWGRHSGSFGSPTNRALWFVLKQAVVTLPVVVLYFVIEGQKGNGKALL